MKRYEKMSKEDIINVITCFAGQVEGPSKIALDALNDMLTKEVETKPRFMTIKSVAMMEDAWDKWWDNPIPGKTFLGYICEEVEVTE